MRRYLALKIIIISSFVLFVIVLKVSYVNAHNNNLDISIDNNSKIAISPDIA